MIWEGGEHHRVAPLEKAGGSDQAVDFSMLVLMDRVWHNHSTLKPKGNLQRLTLAWTSPNHRGTI